MSIQALTRSIQEVTRSVHRETPDLVRYRLVPTRGIYRGGCWAFGSGDQDRELRHFAEAFAEGLGQPVLLVRHPVGGLIKTVGVVGRDPNEKEGRIR